MMCLEMFSVVGYEVVGLIGQGGIGDVYRARQLSTGAIVAVKVLREVAGEPASLHRLQRELEALTALGGQSNVIRLLDVVESESGPALVMEYAPGGSVAALMTERATVLATDEVAFIGQQTASALAAAHDSGIIHRDVKPQNLLIDAYGAVKLCDFGIAALTRSEEFRTRTTALSVRYASPEDLEQDADVGGASDVFSLGATLLHLAHGSPPTLRERVQAWEPPGRDDPVAAELDNVIAACLQPDPTARPSAAEVAQRLDDLAAQINPRRRSLEAAPLLTADPAFETGSTRDRDGSAPTAAASTASASIELDRDVDDETPAAVDIEGLVAPTASERRVLSPADSLRPSNERDRRLRLFAYGAAVVVLAAVAVAVPRVWRAVAGSADEPAVTARRVVARDDGVAGLDEVQLPIVAVGECLAVEPDATQAVVVPCDEVHDGEVLAVERVPATLDGDFDAAAVDATATEYCGVIEAPESEPGLAILVISPSAESWENGDRRLLCLLAAPEARIAPPD